MTAEYTQHGEPDGLIVQIRKALDAEPIGTVWTNGGGVWLVRNEWGRQLAGSHDSRQAAIDYAIQQHEEPTA